MQPRHRTSTIRHFYSPARSVGQRIEREHGHHDDAEHDAEQGCGAVPDCYVGGWQFVDGRLAGWGHGGSYALMTIQPSAPCSDGRNKYTQAAFELSEKRRP